MINSTFINVTPNALARATGIDPLICAAYLAGLSRVPRCSDQLGDPYPIEGGGIAVAASLGQHVVELSALHTPRISCFARGHHDWDIAVTDNPRLLGTSPAGIVMVTVKSLAEVLDDLLTTTRHLRPAFQGRPTGERGTVARVEEWGR